LHGNAKTPADLKAAFTYGVGHIVIDSPEIARIAALAPQPQRVGFSLSSGAAADAVRRVLAHSELDLIGLHCHLGSQLTEVPAYEAAASWLGLMALVRKRYGVVLGELSLGGGHAVPYVAGDDEFDLAGFASRMRRAIASECIRLQLPVPRLVIEPGRPRRGARHRRVQPLDGVQLQPSRTAPVIAVREGTARPLVRRDDQRPAGRDIGL
jgi:diaminopimelate decarboxylase